MVKASCRLCALGVTAAVPLILRTSLYGGCAKCRGSTTSMQQAVAPTDARDGALALDPPEGRWRASNPCRVGQGSKGLEGSLVDGMVPRKGSAKAPFTGLDEIISMTWRHPNSAGLVSMKWPPWNGLGSWGQERPQVDGCRESEVSRE